ncbi:MAG: TMEM175 family protein [Pseudomonadota bacterium]|nr:TMEM175 family protein [Pseudomonadota bacterium]
MAGEPESLDTSEGLERRRHRHGLDRLIMLADGVFAIAITLLAFDLRGPALWDRRLASLWANLAPQLDAYALSVVAIGVYWLAHRRFMAMVHTVDAPMTVLTIVMLALVALLPAATRLTHALPSSAAMLIYGALIVAIGAAMAAIWGYAALIADRVSPEVPKPVRWFLLALMLFTPPFFLLLVTLIPGPRTGEIPLSLVALFLIGWPMRLWVVRRLTPKRAPAEETT